MLNKLHQEVSIAKASLIKIPPVWFTLQTVFIMCITNSHQAPAMDPGGGPSKEAVLFVWHLRHQSTSEDHRMSASYKSKTKSSPSQFLEGLSVLFKEMLWSSKTTLPLALGILLNQVKRVKRVKQASIFHFLSLPIQLVA